MFLFRAVGKNFELELSCDVVEGRGVCVGIDRARAEGIVSHCFERSFYEGFPLYTKSRFVDVRFVDDLLLLRFRHALHARCFSAGEDDERCWNVFSLFHKGER